MLFLLVANLIILPVAISFFNDDLSIRWIAFNCLSDTIFMIDIVVNFRTGVYLIKHKPSTFLVSLIVHVYLANETGIMQQDNSEQVILDPKLIARHYLRTWFFLDLISSIPLDYIFLIFNQVSFTILHKAPRPLLFFFFFVCVCACGNSRNNGTNVSFAWQFLRMQDFSESFQILQAGRALRILRLAKLLSLVRLLRLSRLVRYVNQWEEVYVSAGSFGLFSFLSFSFLLDLQISKNTRETKGKNPKKHTHKSFEKRNRLSIYTVLVKLWW